MQGLYLNPDSWYGEREIETWLNTRALHIDRVNRQVQLGTGEKLPYDKLILAMGSSSVRPADRGLRPGRHGRPAQGRRRDPRAQLRPASRREEGRRGRWRPARPRGGVRAAPARDAGDRARALRPPAQAPARPARRGAAAALPRRPGPGDHHQRRDAGASSARGGWTRSSSSTAAAWTRELLLVAAGIQPNAELAKRGRSGHQPRRARRRPHADRRSAHPRGRRRRRVRGPGPRPVADRGRPGRGRRGRRGRAEPSCTTRSSP